MRKKKERKTNLCEKIKKLSCEELDAFMDLVSFVFAVYPLFNTFEQLKSYLNAKNGNSKEMSELEHLMGEMQKKLYEKIRSMSSLDHSFIGFRDCLLKFINTIPLEEKGIPVSKAMEVLFAGAKKKD